jgi:hypothetical protein
MAAKEKAQESPDRQNAGMHPRRQQQPWQGMHRGGWGFGGPQGPQFHGYGPWGHQFPGYGPQFRGYGPWGQSIQGFGPGPQHFGPHAQPDFAMNRFYGPGPQFHGERRDSEGPGPEAREQGPRHHDRGPADDRDHDRGPHADRSWWD